MTIPDQTLRLRPSHFVLLALILATPASAQEDRALSAEAIVERLTAAIGEAGTARESLPEGVRFVVHFTDDVGSLEVGSPVTVKGRRVGTVREVAVVIDTDRALIDVPVVFDVVPDRINIDNAGTLDEAALYALAEQLVAKGLRAGLQSATPLGGRQRVELAFVPDSTPATLARDKRYPEIPAAPSLSDKLRVTIETLVARLAGLPLERFADEAVAALAELRALVGGAEIRQVLENLSATSDDLRALIAGPELRQLLDTMGLAGRDLQSLVTDLAARLDPSINAMQRAAESVEAAAAETNVAMADLKNAVGPRSPLWDELMQTSRELSGATRALRLLVEYLERHPDALLRGRPEVQP